MSDPVLHAPDASRTALVREEFQALSDHLIGRLQADEVLFCALHGEDSDFVRFNHGQIRQAGSVLQRSFGLHLIRGRRHVSAEVSISGEDTADRARLAKALGELRERLPLVPEDPYLLYAEDVCSSTRHAENVLPEASQALGDIRRVTEGLDLVGVYASGSIYGGLTNSLGQRNWYDTRNFNFDWSVYHQGDKAVKSAYAGFTWEPEAFARKVDVAATQLEALRRSPKNIRPGRYRVYLAPAAVHDVLGLLSWGGFGLKALKTRQSPLLKLADGRASFDASVELVENTAEGIAPDFQEDGFIRPPVVPLVQGGRMAGSLVSPRSAKEYGVETNGATAMESPESLDMAAGSLPQADVLSQLGTGIWIGNVWYLNYSDRAACRTTGMTRFATFWVENGEVVAPLNVMRFDETVYRMLGSNLVGLTRERELVLDAGSYLARETSSGRYPGALIEDFQFTL